MLILKPNCELCDQDLPPEATDALICSYECTFCQHCVEHVLKNVCPNCGGGFARRPIRPSKARRPGVSLIDHPASNDRVLTKLDIHEIKDFTAKYKDTMPQDR